MFDQFVQKAGELVASGEPFAMAMVVRYMPPISGKPGDKAIVFPDGTVWGWIGGGCTQPVVVKEALKAMSDGQSRMVHISPSASKEEGIVDYTMTCHSGGALDIYIEPVLPRPQLVIFGRSPVGQALAKLAKAIDYRVFIAAPQASKEKYPGADHLQENLDLSGLKISARTFIVVSTQGESDEEALEQALKTDASYVAFVSSKTKAAKVVELLSSREGMAERIGRIKSPAGLGVWADSPEEIAVSILAEIVELNSKRVGAPSGEAAKMQEAIDPICGMKVSVSGARHTSEFESKTYYFCCSGCKREFDEAPARYLLASASR